jgi:hypothetical protein
VAAVRCPQTA